MLVKNISYSVLFKILRMTLSLMMVPLLLEILGVTNYGLWAALTSLIVWVTLFDFGMGNALKNSVSKAVAIGKPELAHDEFYQVIKLSVFSSFVIVLIFLFTLFSVNFFRENLIVSMSLFLPIIILFPLRVASFVLQGARQIAMDSGLMFLNTLIFFAMITGVYLLDVSIGLILLAVSFVISYSISILLVASKAMKILNIRIYDFNKILKVEFDFIRIKLGLKFFGLQVSSLVLYSLGTIIVYSYLSSEHAAQFDIVNKIFVFGLSFFSIVIGAFWPEITTHRAASDFRSIRSLYFKMIGLSLIFTIAAFIIAYFSPYIVQVWTGSKLEVTRHQAMFFALLVSTQAIAYSGAVILNAFEKINIQLVLSLVTTVLMLPLTIYTIRLGYEIEAVPIVSAMLTSIAMVYCNVHAYKLIREN
ncbi:hypothetical protein GPUN_2864 [Glaciecola punicea ACAM 611]|uniref:Polysaccharide biosynthesis protein n=1 Tax=Glaciecola punicea ACAM 611 TaxID=1121923 RepID=H5TF51_9ALTE|nr:oligosaccharide flippase family protein [Glaciecola punicea]GAB56978.1 hypothetical protein GPUN_2864 [Glaciecola punicea ACAM 611]